MQLREEKLEIKKYEADKKSIDEQLETNRCGQKDNFAQLLATDNYLEKYLPFKVQSMITAAVTETLVDKRIADKYQKFDYNVFKQLHREVIHDQGLPTLKKRAFEMPGFRQVMNPSELDFFKKAQELQGQERHGTAMTDGSEVI